MLVQQAKSGDLHIGRNATWGMSINKITVPNSQKARVGNPSRMVPIVIWSEQVSILEIAPEHFANLRVPSGNEGGVNANWIPGGYTSGGVPEAVMNLSSLSSDKFIVLDITP